MELRRPPCGNEEAHDAHGFFTTGHGAVPVSTLGTQWAECPGWTQADAATSKLIGEMLRLIREQPELPEGIGLECHPMVTYHLAAHFIPGYMEFTGERDPRNPFPQIPVIACPAMERGAWRIATIRRDVITEGKIPDVLAGER
jgi:hypothetical protein